MTVGDSEGKTVGEFVVATVGGPVGLTVVGLCVGLTVGDSEGKTVGIFVGATVGGPVG